MRNTKRRRGVKAPFLLASFMKNNVVHALVGFISSRQPDGNFKHDWRYDELPAAYPGVHEHAMKAHCDTLETDGLIYQRKKEGYISIKYEECRKAFESDKYKEVEIPSPPKPTLWQIIWDFIKDFAGLLASAATVGAFVLGLIAIEQGQEIKRLSTELDSLKNRVEAIEDIVKNDSLGVAPRP